MGWIAIAFLVVAIAGVVAVSGHVALTWAARRGWIFYRDPHRPRPHTLGLIEEIYQPSIEHVIDEEASEAIRADQAESGDPDRPGHASGP
jgi:hypothetical protein